MAADSDPDTDAAPRGPGPHDSRGLGVPSPASRVARPVAVRLTARDGLLLLVLAVLWFGLLGQRSLIHSDEGRYAALALGMLDSGDWVTPRLNGLLYFEKPALSYWIGAAAFRVFGVNEFAARFWPALAGFLTVLVVAYTGARLWGRETGLRAAAVAASATWMVGNSHFLTLDMGLTLFLTLVLCSLLMAQRVGIDAKAQRAWMWSAWAGMALAVLSKGLVGIVIPGAALLIWSVWQRSFAFWRRMHWLSGLAIALAIAAPWFVVVSLRNPGFADFFFIHEHFARYLTTEHRREGAWWYFVPWLLLGLLPWTSALPWLRPGQGETMSARRMLLAWCGFVFVFFSASGSKLPSYILPMFPALALLVAHTLGSASPRALQRHLLVLIVGCVVLLALATQYRRFVSASMPPDAMHALARGALAGGAIFLVGAGFARWLLTRERVSAAVLALAFAHTAAVLVAAQGHDAYGQRKSAAPIAAALRGELAPDTQVFAVRSYDQTLPFYLRRTVTLVDYVDEFAYGEQHEPERWIPTLEAFVPRWKAAPHALAYMSPGTLQTLREMGLALRVVYQDERRVVVANS